MIFTLSGASGAGKTSIARGLLKELPIDTRMVPSYTTSTRQRRESDLPGEYKYISKFWFWLLEKIGVFIWTVYPHGNRYGTTKRWATKALKDDDTVYIMILTPKTINDLRKFAEQTRYSNRIFSSYIVSPPQEILRERLGSRGDKEDEIEKRLADCIKWDSEARISGIPYEFVENNGVIEDTVERVITSFLEKLDACNYYF